MHFWPPQNLKIGVFLGGVSGRPLKLCMTVISVKLYTFILGSVTLAHFQGHRKVFFFFLMKIFMAIISSCFECKSSEHFLFFLFFLLFFFYFLFFVPLLLLLFVTGHVIVFMAPKQSFLDVICSFVLIVLECLRVNTKCTNEQCL